MIQQPKTAMAETFWAHIYIAGSIEQAKEVCRKFCFDVGYCVTVEPVDYIYTGGAEAGVRVGLINYPRFSRTPAEILEIAEQFATLLRVGLCQHSYSIVTPTQTFWRSRREAAQ
jgi:hypothetical protein